VRRALAAFAFLLLAALPASAQVLYKWVDASGKVHYSDRMPPKGFDGRVEKIETDIPASPVERPAVAPRAPAAIPPQADLATKRRALREQLWARVDAAREKVEAARKALETGSDIAVEDRRTFVQRVDGPANQALALRSNCRVAKDAATGRDAAVCAASIPNDAYKERVEKLEEALRVAEDELDQALTAYRRGVD